MEKTYKMPNYMLTMFKEYLEKNERPSLEDFLKKYPKYRKYAYLISNYTTNGDDLIALAGKALIDNDSIQGYRTEFDAIIGRMRNINNMLENVALGVVDKVSFFRRSRVITPQFEFDLDIEQRKDEAIVFRTRCTCESFLVGYPEQYRWGNRYVNVSLYAKRGNITFTNLTMETLCRLFCEKDGDQEIQEEVERILLRPEFVASVEEFSNKLYASSRKQNPMDILIK